MDTEIKNAVRATGRDAQYDESAKRLLGNKSILAHILVKTVDEFKGMKPKEAENYIKGSPCISTVPVEPGLTNMAKKIEGNRIVGFNSEYSEKNEGLVRFDIVFYVSMKDGLSQIIINIEAQKDVPTEYKLLNRAIFYVSRLISSQKERDFVNTNYNDIKRVFSIWVCMNMNKNTINYVHLIDDNLLGDYQCDGNLNLLNIIMLGITNKLPEHDEEYNLHRLLGTLLSSKLSADEKLDIIETEYHIPIEEGIRKDVSVMCNLSQGIKEEGIAIGEARGEEIGEAKGKAAIIINMYKKGIPIEEIAEIAEKSIEDVQAIIDGKGAMPA